jgi:hypothetical protein
MIFGTFIQNHALGFIHVLCGRILFVNKSIFYIAMSFVDVVMGDKLNIVVT